MDFTRMFQHWEFNINTCTLSFFFLVSNFFWALCNLFATSFVVWHFDNEKTQEKYLKCKHMQMLKANIFGWLCRRAKHELELKLKLDLAASKRGNCGAKNRSCVSERAAAMVSDRRRQRRNRAHNNDPLARAELECGARMCKHRS